MDSLCFNGTFLPAGTPLFTSANRGFRYGDGLFETMRWERGRVRLTAYHFDRLRKGVERLRIPLSPDFTPDVLTGLMRELVSRNGCADLARIRLSVYREEEGEGSFVLEAVPLDASYTAWMEKGYSIDIYPLARKSTDGFAQLKSANYLPYVLAGRYAAEQGLDECLVLNSENAVADGSKTNLFVISGGVIRTPSLHQGCVGGVMRRYLLETLKREGYGVEEVRVTESDLLHADEVFLTNALMGLRWVERFREKTYACTLSKKLYHTYLQSSLMP